MKSVIIIALAFVLLIPIGMAFGENHIEFSTDKELYYAHQVITVSGIVDIDPDIPFVLVEIFNPEKGLEDWTSPKPNPDGTFIAKFGMSSETFPYGGKYTIKVTYGGSVEKIITYSSIAPFVDESKDPQSYVDRYNNEPQYKKWFDDNYRQYDSIYEAVGLKDPTIEMSEPVPEPVKTADDVYKMICSSPDGYCMSKVGFNNPDAYGACLGRWVPFCRTYEAKQTPDTNSEILCGEGTIENEFGQCVLISQTKGGGCLIATATYGSELAPQVQMLREIRDNSLLQTQSGQSFMQGFNEFYYSFSPTIADYERQNPVFKEAVKLTITPLLASLSLINYVDLDSEESVLGYGIGIILMNVGMYFVAPALLIVGIYRKHKP